MSLRTETAPRTRHLHRDPPLTYAGVLLRYPWTIPAIIVLFAAMAVAASVANGELLLVWDEPIRNWVTDHRTGALDTFFLNVTDLGNWKVVVVGLVVLLAIAWRTCAPMAGMLIVATLARPACEWLIKTGVGRERPFEGSLVESAAGQSFPTGHVMAAIALWGLVPPVVALVTHRRALWWAATIVSGAIILLVAASRVYMGVHWFSDVIGALLFGAVYLLVIERLGDVGHRRYPCSVYFEPSTPSQT